MNYGWVFVKGKIPLNQWRYYERLHPDRSTITWADFKYQMLLGLGDIKKINRFIWRNGISEPARAMMRTHVRTPAD